MKTDRRPEWVVAPRVGDLEQLDLGADSLLLAQLLWNRGVRSATGADAFLDPCRGTLGDPFLMQGADAAVARLRQAVANDECIAIYGDYDVDGVAGTAVLVEVLRSLGANVVYHLPHRARDGYGVNLAAVQQLAREGARVMVTVDCGITAGREIEAATEAGLDVIVTDHHIVPTELPNAYAVLNPHQDGCRYPYRDLAGGGVALQLARALLTELCGASAADEAVDRMAALAALSTVADVVPLTGENRTIVARGLEHARAGERPGFQAICALAGRVLERLSVQDLSFSVIPRLNAAGRMGDAKDALELLLATDLDTAQRLAARLEVANAARRDQLAQIMDEIEDQALFDADQGAIVLAGEYPIGLAGLIAARVAERFHVPCAVVEQADGLSRGSVRGGNGIHLVEVLGACGSALVQFGGHARAAGFSLRTEEISRFRDAFVEAATAAGKAVRTAPSVPVDAQLKLESVHARLADLVERFEPCGAGNARPTFVSRELVVRQASTVRGGHLQLRLAKEMAQRRAIAFRPVFDPPRVGSKVDVLYQVERSIWAGQERVELIVQDLMPSASAPREPWNARV